MAEMNAYQRSLTLAMVCLLLEGQLPAAPYVGELLWERSEPEGQSIGALIDERDFRDE